MSKSFEAVFQRERLHTAAGEGDLAEVERLLAAGYRPDRFDDLAWTPLHYAVRGRHWDVFDRLIEAGADVNAHLPERIGDTPCTWSSVIVTSIPPSD